jgi:hypothetical protein
MWQVKKSKISWIEPICVSFKAYNYKFGMLRLFKFNKFPRAKPEMYTLGEKLQKKIARNAYCIFHHCHLSFKDWNN